MAKTEKTSAPRVEEEQTFATYADPAELRSAFAPLFADTGGIDSWLGPSMPEDVFRRLAAIEREALSRSQLNQLLVLSREAGLSEGFFRYYWLTAPDTHTYDVRAVPGYEFAFLSGDAIRSLRHLKWGLYRFYMDALLYFGNIRSAYRFLRELSEDDLVKLFSSMRFDALAMRDRGDTLPLQPIPKEDRYLISEMACKSFDLRSEDLMADLQKALKGALEDSGSSDATTIENLIQSQFVAAQYPDRVDEFRFSATSLLSERVTDSAELDEKYAAVAEKFQVARSAALKNTNLYLSMIEELDVYVATSMRTREDFLAMAEFCDYVFTQPRLEPLRIRYFDPTLSAAEGHEDKGLIECLMVKCAKALVYSAGTRESLGKDLEAAMALSLGKPVIFYCEDPERQRFFRDVHPLTRLIDFESGVPVGAMITSKQGDVAELLSRIFENRMEYEIEQHRPGHLRLKERLTGSVVRLQTSDALLRETFWNYYHRFPPRPLKEFPGVGRGTRL
jgi:hypothetical protein